MPHIKTLGPRVPAHWAGGVGGAWIGQTVGRGVGQRADREGAECWLVWHPVVYFGFCANPLPGVWSLYDVDPAPEAAPSPPIIDFVAVGSPDGGTRVEADAGVDLVRLPLA